MSKKPSIPKVALLCETSLASGRDILRGVARYVRQHGPWSLYHRPHGMEQGISGWKDQWRGDGIIARVTDPAMAEALHSLKVPVVDVLGIVPDAGFPVVHVNDSAIATMAAEHLLERGFRRFAYVGFHDQNWSVRRREAFLKLTSQVDPAPQVFDFSTSEMLAAKWDKRQQILAKWLSSLPKPVGLMVCSDQCGSDVLEAAQRGGVEIPHQIAVVGADDDEPLCEVCHPPLSSVSPDHSMVGYLAAKMLEQWLAGSAPGQQPLLVEPRFVVTRQSTDIMAVEDQVVSKAIEIIRENACANLGVNQIAQRVGVSRSVLQRRFQSVLRSTVHDQIISARIKVAREMLLCTQLPLAVIAEKAGFGHQEYMGAVFRTRLGRTPGSFR